MILSKDKFLIAMGNATVTIAVLQEKSGVSRNTISRILNSDIKTRPHTVGKLAKALGVKVEDLI